MPGPGRVRRPLRAGEVLTGLGAFALVVPPGAVLLVLFSYRTLGLLGDSWITLAVAALVLLVMGSLFEKMRDRVRAARTYLAALR